MIRKIDKNTKELELSNDRKVWAMLHGQEAGISIFSTLDREHIMRLFDLSLEDLNLLQKLIADLKIRKAAVTDVRNINTGSGF